MAPRKRKHNADEKALPEVTAADRAAVEEKSAKKKPEPNAATPYDKMTSQERTAIPLSPEMLLTRHRGSKF